MSHPPDHLETFEHFMQRCLHHPTHGYYARHIPHIGHRGDFTTAPQLSHAPAAAIASWAAHAMKKHRCHHLIEIGPGLGTLALQVLRALPPLTRLRTTLHLVETSPPLAAKQKETLQKKAIHHKSLPQALAASRGKAIIYSNELVDAFPIRLFEKTQTTWQEIALDHSSPHPHPREVLLPPAELPPSSSFSIPHPIGQRIEIHDSYRTWLKSWLPLWKKGAILTIDYGNTAQNLHHRQPNGTLRAYLLHQRLTGSQIYSHPGKQDITADVNFTDLSDWPTPQLQTDQLLDLSDFIHPHLHPKDPHLLQAASHFRALFQTRTPP